MEYGDIIMAIDNDRGEECNYLMDRKGAIEEICSQSTAGREEFADFIAQLERTRMHESGKEYRGWAEIYLTPSHTINMSYCKDREELVNFMNGRFNDTEDWGFEQGMSGKECLDFLEGTGISKNGSVFLKPRYSYQNERHDFAQGERLKNFNGKEYLVLECLTEDNILLLDIQSGEFVAGIDTQVYRKIPDGMPGERETSGIEWGHGIYLGTEPTKIDFEELRQKYGRERSIESLSGYREMLKEKFSILKKAKEHPFMPDAVWVAAEDQLYSCFGTANREEFTRMLSEGRYDGGYETQKEKRPQESQKEFQLEVREEFQRVVKEKAGSLDEAIDRIMEKCSSGEIDLDARDFKGREVVPYEEYKR